MYLSYVGLRVRDLARSIRFYTEGFGLVLTDPGEPARIDPKVRWAVLLRDPRSGQRIELNYYPPGDPYAVPYTPGEALDHVAFRVDDLPATLERLEKLGHPPERMAHYEGPMLTTPHYRMAYVRDPDEISLELFDAPGTGEYSPNQY
ncbi:MAG TPA: VOC family protein [Thermoplasmata archaeon]|jgi:catechol 2,3-dioxygenase-like lactoylglutathione lyase family enzyme|nr:VOC family protein [Thermoplasmata archaeon]